jgi:predicted anti-sigma-YlaC factor YlaD
VKEHSCQTVSKEELVAYTDGDLSPNEAEWMAEHLTSCPDCRAFVEALEQSLKLTKAIWQTAHTQWPEICSFEDFRKQRWPYRKAIAIVASILLILSIGTVWRLLSESHNETRKLNEEAKITELKLKIAESSHAAQLLAAAELLSKYPELHGSVEERYRHIIEAYPDTTAAAEARLKTRQFK